jgi:transglutaminase-like putative cysteine protease
VAVLAAAAVAIATWCAAAALAGAGVGGIDVPLPLVALGLAAGVAGAGARRSARVLPPGKDVVMLTAVTVAGFVGLYLAGWTGREHETEIARLLPLAVVGLGVLWPEPNVLRYCTLLAAGTLLGAAGEPVGSRAAVGIALVAMAVAVVATNRLVSAGAARLGGPDRARARRLAGEAAAVLAVVGLLAALAASLLPLPPGSGGGDGDGRDDGRGRPQLLDPAAAGVGIGDRLAVGGGRGPRGDEVVFLVDAPAPDVWRATTYDHWDGAAWTRSPEARQPVEDFVLPGIGDPETELGPEQFVQGVTVQARAASVLVAAPRPLFLVSSGPVSQGDDGSLRADRPLVRGQRYVVASDRARPGAEALRSASGFVPPDVARVYLQLPQVPARVRGLAAEITAEAPTAYDMVRAVERWLLDNTTVTDDANPVPAGADPLESFLLDTRRGPPERAATAMAVMLRAVGVPARMAAGFLPGTRTGPDGAFVVRVRHTHAWVEVWFPGVGWQRFDPTGMAPPAEGETESVWDRLWRFLERLLVVVLLLALAAGGWLAWRGVRWWRERAARPWASRFFARLERAGAARGRPRQPAETPAEYASGLSRTVLPDPRLEEVGELVTVGAYSRREPPAEDRRRAEAVLRQAAKAAPARRLRRLRRSRPGPGPTIRTP